MKFSMNGGTILGTLDGANMEMREEVGEENMFIFGVKAEEVESIRSSGGWPVDPRLKEVIQSIRDYRWAEAVCRQIRYKKIRPLLMFQTVSHPCRILALGERDRRRQ
jgi:glucan phosphorylase